MDSRRAVQRLARDPQVQNDRFALVAFDDGTGEADASLIVRVADLVEKRLNEAKAEIDKAERETGDVRAKLLAEAGYPDGFDITLDCPNNRYVNDEEICQALVSMWARVGIRAQLNLLPNAVFSQRVRRQETAFYGLMSSLRALRRDEVNRAGTRDVFAQAEWGFAKDWLLTGGLERQWQRVDTAHDLSDGGLAVALAESAMSGPDRLLGAVVTLALGRLRTDAVLFGESQSRVVLSAKPVHRQAILDGARRAGVPVSVIGSVTGDRLVVSLEGEQPASKVIDVPVAALYDRWAFSIERALKDE